MREEKARAEIPAASSIRRWPKQTSRRKDEHGLYTFPSLHVAAKKYLDYLLHHLNNE